MKMILAVLALAVGASTVQAQQADTIQKATVTVHNDAPISATVYVVDRGIKVRLGTVSAASNAQFSIRPSDAPASFYVSSMKGNATTNEIQNVRAGDRLVLNIAPEVSQSYASR